MEKQPSSPESLPKLERQPAIEEPKTLLPADLKAARKAALEVMSKHTKEEALKIFLKVPLWGGDKPMKSSSTLSLINEIKWVVDPGLEPVKIAVKLDWELDNLVEDGEQDV